MKLLLWIVVVALAISISIGEEDDDENENEFNSQEFEYESKGEDHEAFKRQSAESYRKRALDLHNEYRARHGSPPLVLDDKLNRDAQSYAEYEKKTNVQKHSCSNCDQYGENLAYKASTAPANTDKSAAVEWACKEWYDEISLYNFNSPNLSSNHKWGHFTALVWKATRKMGIGVAFGTKRSAKGNTMNTVYVVARYFPPGNVWSVQTMKENVPPLN